MISTPPQPVRASGENTRVPFDESIAWITQVVSEELSKDAPDLSRLEQTDDCVFLKNREHTLVATNRAFREFFADASSPIGRDAQAFLDETILAVSKYSDALISSGVDYVEFGHVGYSRNGGQYSLRSYKGSLRDLKHPGFASLGISRPVKLLTTHQPEPNQNLNLLYNAFRELDARDQDICRMTALGLSSREIGEEVGISGRAVEMRRQKSFAALSVSKPIDLARQLVRLQERGYIDLHL